MIRFFRYRQTLMYNFSCWLPGDGSIIPWSLCDLLQWFWLYVRILWRISVVLYCCELKERATRGQVWDVYDGSYHFRSVDSVRWWKSHQELDWVLWVLFFQYGSIWPIYCRNIKRVQHHRFVFDHLFLNEMYSLYVEALDWFQRCANSIQWIIFFKNENWRFMSSVFLFGAQ